jgi:RNA polymerase sigma factor (sigma-70 family)
VSDLAASATPATARGVPLRVLGDERLARLTAAGSERAFAVLYERHHQALYRYCRTIVRHDEDARDVLQTTMVRALAALARGVPDAPMRPWLFRIAHNEAVSVLRRRRPTIDLDQAPELEAPRVETRVEERSRLETLVADLQELPDRQRSALVMRELSGLSHADIAGALEISVSAAKQAIFDARTGLQEFANGRAMNCADVQRVISERDGRALRGRPLRAHLRGCEACRTLREAIGARRADLAAIAPPLPAAAATGLLSGILGGGGHGGGGLTSTVAAKVASGALGAKTLAGAAVVATVAVGTTQVLPPQHVPSGRDAARPAAAAPSASPASTVAPAAGPAGADRGSVAATATVAARGASTSTSAATRRHGTADARPAGASARSHASRPAATAGHASAPAATSNAASSSRPAAAHHAPGRPAVRPARSRPARRPVAPASRAPAGSAHGRPVAPASRAPARPARPAHPPSAPAARPAHPATPAPPTGGGAPAASAGGGAPAATPVAAAPAAPAPASATPAAARKPGGQTPPR